MNDIEVSTLCTDVMQGGCTRVTNHGACLSVRCGHPGRDCLGRDSIGGRAYPSRDGASSCTRC